MTKRLLTTLGILILLFGAASTAFAGKSYRAERFDADWQINSDGSLSVVETVVFDFSGGPFTFVYRELRSDKSNGIDVLAVSMDGQPLSKGKAAGQYEITGSSTQKVTWHFSPTSDASHTFVLRYRVLGAVRRDMGDDLLYWHFLPTDYEYGIDSATLLVSYPATAVRISKADIPRTNSSLLETDHQVKFTALDIPTNTRIPVSLRFAGGSLIGQPPAWQQRETAVAQRAPGMWLATALVLSLGTVLLALVWRGGARPSGSVPEARTMTRSAPPSDLSPALAGALANYGGKAGLVQAMATLFTLAQSGVLAFVETGEKKWYRGPQFVVRFQPRALDAVRLEPHEEALVDGLFDEKGKYEIQLSELGRRLQKVARPFGKAVETDLIGRGLLDPARITYARRFLVLGGLLLGLDMLAGIAAVLLVFQLGGWVLLIPFADFLLAMLAFGMGAAYSARSAQGEAEAAAWRGFRDYMRGVVKGSEPNWDARLFDRYFPYAATFDLAQGWAKAFRDRGGGEVPGWFRSLSTASADRMGAFVVMTSAVHSTTASGGSGGGGGGAGGGGGSGAG